MSTRKQRDASKEQFWRRTIRQWQRKLIVKGGSGAARRPSFDEPTLRRLLALLEEG